MTSPRIFTQKRRIFPIPESGRSELAVTAAVERSKGTPGGKSRSRTPHQTGTRPTSEPIGGDALYLRVTLAQPDEMNGGLSFDCRLAQRMLALCCDHGVVHVRERADGGREQRRRADPTAASILPIVSSTRARVRLGAVDA